MDSDLIFHLPAEVTTADADFTGKLRTGALVNLLLQSAVRSADALGFGLAYLRENDLFWALSRLSLEIPVSMSWRDRLIVETWPRDIDGFYYLRDFVVRDDKGLVCARAASAWLAVGTARKRPVRLSGETADIFTRLREHSSGITDLPRLQPPESPPRNSSMIRPAYFDLDLNGHVTTTRYVDWIMDTFSLEFHRSHRIQALDVNFMKEILPGNTVRLDHYSAGDRDFFEGNMDPQATPAFRAAVRWTTR